jgi:hypothetical protein
VSEQSKDAIKILNEYSAEMCSNNARILAVLEGNSALMDIDDVPSFIDFGTNRVRQRVEARNEGPKLPWRVQIENEQIITFDSAFVNMIAEKWREKQSRLKRLQGRRSWRLEFWSR